MNETFNSAQRISMQIMYTSGVKYFCSVAVKTRDKGRARTRSYNKSAYTQRKIRKATWQHKHAAKNFDYTTIADRRSVGVTTFTPLVWWKLVYERSTFPLTTTTTNTTLIFLEIYSISSNKKTLIIYMKFMLLSPTIITFWASFYHTPYVLNYSRTGLTCILTLELHTWKSVL